jgi:hypothetical protein
MKTFFNFFKISSPVIIFFWAFTFFSADLSAQQFEASAMHKYVFLKWKWPADQQPDHFEIERRNRGGAFGMIAMTFSGEPNDTSSLYYKDKLTGVEDHYYYRIKAAYPDGHFAYSEIVSLSFEKSSEDKLIDATLDANSGKIKLALPSLDGTYICRIYNMNGVLLSVEKPFACAPELSLAKVDGKKFFIESYHPQTGKKFYSTFSRN